MVHAIISEGISWNVLDTGAGNRTLVFLPGTLGSVNIFDKQVRQFAGSHRVIVLGYPGSSDLDALEGSFWALLDKLEVDRPYLVGSSLGAYLLQHFTSKSAHSARGLVLGNTFVHSHRLRFLRMFDPAVVNQASPQQVKQMWLQFAENLASPELRTTLLPMVRDVQADTELHGRCLAIAHLGPVASSALPADRITVLSCVDDPVCNAAVSDEVAAAYGKSRHVRLATGGHYPHVLNADAYGAALAEAFA